MDPQRATDTISIAYLKQMYEPLLRLDENDVLIPGIAEEVPTLDNGGISADGKTYTFKLRSGLKWSDGTPLVAEDLANGAKRLFEPGSGNFYVDFYRVLATEGNNIAAVKALGELDPEDGDAAAALEAIENDIVQMLEVTAPDDRTVVYQLNAISPVFLLLATMWPLYPIRQDLIDANGDQWTEAGNHVSNGVWYLDTWDHDQFIRLVRNPNFHDASVGKLDVINVDQITDAAVQFLAYLEGELDYVKLGPAELVQVRNDTDLQSEFQAYAQTVTIGTYFNNDSPPFDDVRVRQAFAGSYDRNELAEVVLEGSVLPAYSWLPPGIPGHDPTVGLQYQDAVAASQQLLADAGFPGGEGLEVEYLTSDSSTSVLIAEWQKQQWETNLGVTVNIKVLDTATYFAERNASQYQLVGGGWGADYKDPQNWMPLFRTGGLINSGNFSNAEYDALLDAADLELDNDRRIAIYQEAQEIFVDQLPFSPSYFRRRNILLKSYVKGLVPTGGESDMAGDDHFRNIFISGRNA